MIVIVPYAGAKPNFSGSASVQEVKAIATQYACTGCGCKGGPGYRLSNGKCVGHRR